LFNLSLKSSVVCP